MCIVYHNYYRAHPLKHALPTSIYFIPKAIEQKIAQLDHARRLAPINDNIPIYHGGLKTSWDPAGWSPLSVRFENLQICANSAAENLAWPSHFL